MNPGIRSFTGLLAFALAVGCSSSDKKKSGGSDSGSPPQGWRAAVGDDGTLVATFDDATWSARRIAHRDLRAVTCVGNLTGWVAGSGGLILHTTDGGDSFAEQSAGTSADLHAIRFARTATGGFVGVAAGDVGALAVSHDGTSWSPVAGTPPTALRAAAIAHHAGIVLVVGDGGAILRSADAGGTFQNVAAPEMGNLTGVAIEPAGLLALVAAQDGGLWASTDGGVSFSREHAAGGPLGAVAMDESGAHALSVGAGGRALGRDPHGAWTELPTGLTADLSAALVTHEGDRWYLAGAAGTLASSIDSGAHWVPAAAGTTVVLRALEDLDPN